MSQDSPGDPSWTLQVIKVSVGQSLSSQLEQLILDGRFESGARLPPERQLAQHLNLSRTSVREAIHELALKGLVQKRQGVGTIVVESPVTRVLVGRMSAGERSVAEVMDFRRAVEPEIAALAAQRATAADVAEMQRYIIEMTRTTLPARTAELDAQFHLHVARATQNGLLAQLIDEASDWIRLSRRTSLQGRRRRAASLAGHARILEAIRRKDPVAARNATRSHIDEVERIIRAGDRNAGT